MAAATALVLVVLGAYSVASLEPLPDEDRALVMKVSWPHEPGARAAGSRALPDPAELIVPVDGVAKSKLSDSWGAPRDGGRTHKGIDIMAPKGTPVRAAAAGKVIKLFHSARGGTTIYQQSESGRIVFYYAHLDHYAAGVRAGSTVAKGDTIAFVGMSGNAPVPHLHFEIQRADAGHKWWRGRAMDPYPVLMAGRMPAAHAASITRME